MSNNRDAISYPSRVEKRVLFGLLSVIGGLLVLFIGINVLASLPDKHYAIKKYNEHKKMFLYIAEQLSEIELTEDEYFVAYLNYEDTLVCEIYSLISNQSISISVSPKLESSLCEVFSTKDIEGERFLQDIIKVPNTKNQIILTFPSHDWFNWDSYCGITVNPDREKLRISDKKIVNESGVIMQKPDDHYYGRYYVYQTTTLKRIDAYAYYFKGTTTTMSADRLNAEQGNAP